MEAVRLIPRRSWETWGWWPSWAEEHVPASHPHCPERIQGADRDCCLSSWNRKVDMTVRIGMSEESVLQALAQAVVQTPLCQDYPPEFHTAYWSENIQS